MVEDGTFPSVGKVLYFMIKDEIKLFRVTNRMFTDGHVTIFFRHPFLGRITGSIPRLFSSAQKKHIVLFFTNR